MGVTFIEIPHGIFIKSTPYKMDISLTRTVTPCTDRFRVNEINCNYATNHKTPVKKYHYATRKLPSESLREKCPNTDQK